MRLNTYFQAIHSFQTGVMGLSLQIMALRLQNYMDFEESRSPISEKSILYEKSLSQMMAPEPDYCLSSCHTSTFQSINQSK